MRTFIHSLAEEQIRKCYRVKETARYRIRCTRSVVDVPSVSGTISQYILSQRNLTQKNEQNGI